MVTRYKKEPTYLEARAARLEYVKEKLKLAAAKLTLEGFTVFISNRFYYLVAHKDVRAVTLGFTELPYSWYLGIRWKPNERIGSGKVVKTKDHHLSEGSLFSTKEIEEALYPRYPNITIKEVAELNTENLFTMPSENIDIQKLAEALAHERVQDEDNLSSQGSEMDEGSIFKKGDKSLGYVDTHLQSSFNDWREYFLAKIKEFQKPNL